MSNLPSRGDFYIPTAEGAKKEAARQRGDSLRLPKAGQGGLVLRFAPAFAVRNGDPVWWSFGRRHYKVPGAQTDSKTFTFDCPSFSGAGRCVVCENEAVFRAAGLWEGMNGAAGSLHCRFNVIDVANPGLGMQVFEDGKTLWNMLTLKLQRFPKLMCPFDGQGVSVERLSDEPWRDVNIVDKVSMDELHPEALDWCRPGTLNDLDASWNFPSIERQLEIFPTSSRMVEDAQEALPPASDGYDVVEAEVLEPEVIAPEQPRGPASTNSAIMDAINKARKAAAN